MISRVFFERDLLMVAEDGLELRETMGEKFGLIAIASLKRGDSVVIIDDNICNHWRKVLTHRGTGWINTSFLVEHDLRDNENA